MTGINGLIRDSQKHTGAKNASLCSLTHGIIECIFLKGKIIFLFLREKYQYISLGCHHKKSHVHKVMYFDRLTANWSEINGTAIGHVQHPKREAGRGEGPSHPRR